MVKGFRFFVILVLFCVFLTSFSFAVSKVLFWHAYSTTSGEYKVLTEKVIPGFNKLHPDIQVVQQQVPYDTMYQKLIVGVRSGVLPDVARMDIIWVPQFANVEILVPLDKEFATDFSFMQNDFFPGPLSTCKWKGHYYGLPLDTNTRVLLWNKKVFEEAGIQGPPKTMDEFIQYIKKLTVHKTVNGKKVDRWGFADGGLGPWNSIPWIASMGGSILNEDNTKAEGYVNSSDSIRALQTVAELYRGGYIAPTIAGGGGLGTFEGYAEGVYAMTIAGPWSYPILKGEYPDFTIDYAIWPTGKGGSRSVVGGEDIVMFNTTKYPKAAWEFTKYMLSKKVQIEFAQVGQMSALNTLANNPEYFRIHPFFKIYSEQLKTAVARNPVPAWQKIDNILGNAWAQTVVGGTPAKVSLSAAAQQIEKALESQ